MLYHNNSKLFNLATVVKALETIQNEINLENLYRKVLHIILENAGAQKGCLILENNNFFSVEAIEDCRSSDITSVKSIPIAECLDIPQTIINDAIKTQKILVIENAINSNYSQEKYIQQYQCKSILCFPILYRIQFVGLLYLENNLTNNAFAELNLEFIKILVSQMAILIQNARLFASKQEESLILQIRSKIDSVLVTTNDLRQMLQQCTQIIVCHLNVAFARIWTYNTEEKLLKLQASAGIYTHIDGAYSTIPVGKYKIGLIAQEQKPHLTNSVQTDARIRDKEWAIREGMVAFAGYPLIADSELMGVVAIFSQKPLNQNIIDLLRLIVGEIAAAIKCKRTEVNLKQKEEQYRSIFETVNDGISIIDLETCEVVEVNPRLCQMYGYSKEEWMKLQPSDYMHPDSMNSFSEFIQTVKSGKEFNASGVCIRKNGQLFDVEVKATSYIYNGKPHALSILRDITERKQSEKVLKERTQELEKTLIKLQSTQSQLIQTEKISQLGQLVAGVAHEVNNPLSFITGNLSHAQGYIEDLVNLINLYQKQFPNPGDIIEEEIEQIDLQYLLEDLPQLISSMKIGTNRIKDIMLSLRNYSRTSSDEKKAVNLHEGIDTTLMILSHRFKAKPERPAIKIVKQYSDLPLVKCDRGKMNQVFMNLISNAIDALEESNQEKSYEEINQNPNIVTITTAVDESWVTVSIADNGTGIPPQVKQKLFDAFFTTKSEGKGTGLGLSISYQIVTENHGGTLECISSPGDGANFLIRIPR